MVVNYNKLWKMLIDKRMTKQKLRQITGISPSVIAKMGKGQSVTTDMLLRICVALGCDFADIMEVDRSENETNL
jgi:DNA-binding Xre family transcriptional regulator